MRLWLGNLPAAMLMLLIAHRATVHAQSADQLTVYSSADHLLGGDARHPGPSLCRPGRVAGAAGLGGRPRRRQEVQAALHAAWRSSGGGAISTKARTSRRSSARTSSCRRTLRSRMAAATFRLSAVPEILTKLLAKPIQLHPSARRLFIGDVPIRFSMSLDKSTPPKLILSFPARGESVDRERARTHAADLSPRARRLQRAGQLQLHRLEHHRRRVRGA